MANVPTTGIAQQAEFGTANTTFVPVKFTDIGSTELTINKIENDELFGGIDTFAPETGLREASIGVSGRAYPGVIGDFIAMVAGYATTTGATAPYTHVFVPDDDVAPAYTIGLSEPNGISAYFTDVRASSLTLEQESGDVLKFSMDGIATDRIADDVTVATTGLETSSFRYNHFTATVKVGAGAAAEYLNFKSLSITIENPVSLIFTLNGEDTAITQEFTGRRSVTVDAQLRFEDDALSLREAFEDNEVVELVFTWDVDANTSLKVEIPNLRILSHDWSRGFDETTLDFSGSAYYDATLEGSIEFTLKNATASYGTAPTP